MINSVILFGDEIGLTLILPLIPQKSIKAIVIASNREHSKPLVEKIVSELNISLLIHPTKNSTDYHDFIAKMKKQSIDLFLVNSYSMILHEDLLSIPRHGAINVHGSLLPKYRGANVLNWVLINGEIKTGVTIHYVDRGIDTGDIIAQKNVPIAIDDTAVTLREKLIVATGELLREALPAILSGTNSRISQNNSEATYVKRRNPEDGFIDWSWPAKRIYNLIRALVKPWPGVFYYNKEGKKIVIDYFLSLKDVEELQEKQIGHIIYQ